MNIHSEFPLSAVWQNPVTVTPHIPFFLLLFRLGRVFWIGTLCPHTKPKQNLETGIISNLITCSNIHENDGHSTFLVQS